MKSAPEPLEGKGLHPRRAEWKHPRDENGCYRCARNPAPERLAKEQAGSRQQIQRAEAKCNLEGRVMTDQHQAGDQAADARAQRFQKINGARSTSRHSPGFLTYQTAP